jgi:hypothetical protein
MMIPITLFALTLTIVGFGAVGTAAEEEATQVQAGDAGWNWRDPEADPAEPATSPDSEFTDEMSATLQADAVIIAYEVLPNHRGYGGVLSDGRIFACDTRADNWGVRTHYITSRGGREHVGDGNGSRGGCGIERPYDGYPVILFRVCAGVNGADTVCRP